MLSSASSFVRAVFRTVGSTAREYLRVDRYLAAVIAVFLLLFVPPITRTADNPQIVAAFLDDEPWMSLALDGMLTKPYGNPANYLNPTSDAYKDIPLYWGYLKYPNIFYYGGAMHQLAFPVYAGLRAVGLPPFPTAIILLRAITTLAALLSVILLYNFALRHASRTAGLLAALYLVGDHYFVMFTTMAHPDALQVLFGLVGLILAVRHSRDGDLPSLAGLGIVCGLVQGTKVGGAWMIPLALLALWWGMQTARLRLSDLGLATTRLAILGVSILFGWFISTPYAFLDPYYFNVLSALWSIQGVWATEGPFGAITLWSWVVATYEYIGPLAAVLVAAAVVRVVAETFMARHNRALTLAMVLCASQFVVYGSGKLYVMIYYLLLAFGLMAVLSFDTLMVILLRITRFGLGWFPYGRMLAPGAAAACLALLSVVFGAPHIASGITHVLTVQLSRNSTAVALNSWATRNIPHDARVAFDNYAYFDAGIFPNAKRMVLMNWPGVAQNGVDYIVLSGWISSAPHFKKLIETQQLEPNDANPFSVRLYQDLLDTKEFGPTRVQGVEYIGHIEAEPLKYSAPSWPSRSNVFWIDWAWTRLWYADSVFRYAAAVVGEMVSPEGRPVSGGSFRVYRLNSPVVLSGSPAALTSGGP